MIVRETHIGNVTDNNDDEKRGRIKFACASLLGLDPDTGQAREFPDFVEPKFPQIIYPDANQQASGFFAIPGVGSTVEIEVVVASSSDQSPGQSSILGMDPKWIACLLSTGNELSSDFTKNYPNRMGWRSKNGHFVIFDDQDDELIISHGDGKAKATLKKEGVVDIEAVTVNVIAGEVNVGEGADSPFVRHTEWEAWAKVQQHPTALGPSGPPIVPPPPTIASTKAKVK